MDNLDEAAYTQADDRCIPPSIPVSNSSTNDGHFLSDSYNKMNQCDNNEQNYDQNNERLLNDVPSHHKSEKACVDDFKLSVENLERIKRNQQDLTEQRVPFNDSTMASCDMQIRTSSPTVKLEMKSESSLITDALTSTHDEENTDRGNIKNSHVKKESANISMKIKSEKDQHSNNTVETHEKLTKSELRHNSEKEMKNKTSKDYR